MAPRHILLIVLAALAITETSTSSSSNRWRRCRNLPTLGNGQVTRNGLNEAVYGCNTGFRLTVTADCLRGRSWTPRVACEEITCEEDPVIPNGSIDTTTINSRSIGAEYNFTCNAGFRGLGTTRCNEMGKWEGAKCIEITCDDDLVIANGSLDTTINSRSIGTEYNFTCNAGFRGLGAARCNVMGKWEGAECVECVALSDTSVPDVKFNSQGPAVSNEADCTRACNSMNSCDVSYFSNNVCLLYPLPFFAISAQPTLQGCIDACDANNDCKLILHTALGVCFQGNSDDLNDYSNTVTDAGSTMLSKNCQI